MVAGVIIGEGRGVEAREAEEEEEEAREEEEGPEENELGPKGTSLMPPIVARAT